MDSPTLEELRIRESFPTALLTGFDGPTVEACLRQLGPELHLLVAGSEAEALRLLGAQPVAVLALGGAIAGERARWLLEEAETAVGAEVRRRGSTSSSAPVPIPPCSRT